MKHRRKYSRRRLVVCGILAVLCLLLATGEIIYLINPRQFSKLLPTVAAMAVLELPDDESYPAGPLPAGLKYDRLYLEKSARKLTAYAGDKPVRVYLVALGTNPLGHKEYQGDRKTPEGKYSVDGKNPNSSYYKNLGVSYPNAADKAYAQKLGKSPGGDIKIHGLAPSFAYVGSAHRLSDWTHGCIAVTNEEMEELYNHTAVGVPIEIVP